MSRIKKMFEITSSEKRSAFGTFLTAGDPNIEISEKLLEILAENDVDFIEIGMPFSDPMADGPAIQASSQRARAAGMTLKGTLDLVRAFRKDDMNTPIVLMGYYNPIYNYGVDEFLRDAVETGVDGLIIVDLPPEEDNELCIPALNAGLNWIRLATPTTDAERLPIVLTNTSGFVYYVAIMGITGTASANEGDVIKAVGRLRQHTDLPVGVGFGIKTPEDVRAITSVADAAVVGSAIVNVIAAHLNNDNEPTDTTVNNVLQFVKRLATGLHGT